MKRNPNKKVKFPAGVQTLEQKIAYRRRLKEQRKAKLEKRIKDFQENK